MRVAKIRTVLGAAIVALVLVAGTAPAAQERRAQQQAPQQDPDSRIAGGERPNGTHEGGAAIRQTPAYPPSEFSAAAFDAATAPSISGLGTGLAGVAEAFDRGGSAAAALYASRHGIDWQAGTVRVRVDAGLPQPGMRLREASSRAVVEQALGALTLRGARIGRVFGPHIEAWVPPGELHDLGREPAVRGIHRPWKMRASVTSEGVAVIGADQWQGIRFRAPTDGLNVGVIDLSFAGYEALRGSELPPEDRLFTRSFRDDGDLEPDDEHGTAVAEIIFDLEDTATIYLAAVETIGDISEAIDYFIDNGVDVINMSLGCVGCGPGDGRGGAIDVVERAPQNDVPFVTSAGNEADRHWIGTFTDTDGDGLHDFAAGDESNTFTGEAGDEVVIAMNWDFDNWFASAQDLDLILVDAQGNIIDQSRDRQAGFAGQEAVEEIIITLPFDGVFHVVVQQIQTSTPQEFELFVEASDLEYVVAERSLTVPADGANVVAVGAARFSNDVPESFSSQGPTKDGRMKPEMAAPDGVSTSSFGPMGFFGTSAASPHVVGAVALLRGRLGLLSGPDAFEVLTARLFDLPPVGPDNISGGGRLALLPPS